MTNPNPNPNPTMIEYMPEPYDNRRCSDYYAYSVKELRGYFGMKHRMGKEHDLVYAFAFNLFHKLDALDCLDGSIRFSDRHSFQMEVTTYLAQNLAIYSILPQRYGGQSRNMLASAMMKFMYRIQRYRMGHKLPWKTLRPLSKKEFGKVIDYIDNSPYIWLLAERWVQKYHDRVEGHYTYPL